MAPDGSGLLTLDALSVQTAPDGYRRIVWMIIGMIKAHPTQHRMPRRSAPGLSPPRPRSSPRRPASTRSCGTEGGIARAMFRVAVSGRWEQEASFFTVVVWRDQAEHAAQSLAKGSRVVVVGRLQQRAWTAEDGSARSVVRSWRRSWGRA